MRRILKIVKYISDTNNIEFHKLKKYFCIYTLSLSFLPYMYVIYLKKIIDLFNKNEKLEIVGLRIAAFTIGIIILNILNIYSLYKGDNLMTHIRMNILKKANEKIFRTDYEIIEKEEFFKTATFIFDLLKSSKRGIEKFINELFKFPGMIFSYIILMTLLFFNYLNYRILLLFFILFIIQIIEEIWNVKYKIKYEKEKNIIEGKLNYLFGVGRNINYVKDIKVFQMDNKINEKVQNNISDFEKILKKIAKRQSILLGIRMAVILGILIFYCYNTVFLMENNIMEISTAIMNIIILFQIIFMNEQISESIKNYIMKVIWENF